MPAVVELRDLRRAALDALLARFGLRLLDVPAHAPIPATYWGEPEAGPTAEGIYARPDTPVHSILHELGHVVCALPERRARMSSDAGSDAGGDAAEECAVCYLQVVLAGQLDGFGRARCLADMDAWGYSFREGSAAAWLAGDGREARGWLTDRGLLDAAGRPTWRLRVYNRARRL